MSLDPPDFMIILDRHKDIKNAIRDVFPFVSSGIWTFQLKQNLRKFQNEKAITIYDNASRVYHELKCKKLMK